MEFRQADPSSNPLNGNAKSWLHVTVIVSVNSLSLLVVGSALCTSYGFPLDDSYIHQTVARNLARYGVLGFIPGVPSSGATSVLWACIQAVNFKLLQTDPVVFNLAISWMLLTLIGVLLFILAQRDGLPTLHSLVFALAPALSGNFMWLALIGMEHLLFVAIALGCIYLWFCNQSRGYALLTGACVGLLALTRPEAMIFGPVLAITGWRSKRQFKQLVTMLTVWLVFIAIVFGVNIYTSHSLMPATLKGRSWLYFHLIGGPHSLQSILNFIVVWVVRHFLLLPLAITGAVRLASREVFGHIKLLFLFAALHATLFLLLFPSGGNAGRYQPLTLLCLFPCMFFGLLNVFERTMKGHTPQTISVVAIIVLCAVGTASLLRWRIASIDSIAHINSTHAQVAQWLQGNAPANAQVAVFDIGRVSYDWNHSIIDLGGLVEPSYFPYLVDGRVPIFVQERHADFVILPSGTFAADLGFSDFSKLPLAKVAEFCSPNDVWYVSVRYTENAQQCQSVYKVQRARQNVNVSSEDSRDGAVLRKWQVPHKSPESSP